MSPKRLTVVLCSIEANYTVISRIDANSVICQPFRGRYSITGTTFYFFFFLILFLFCFRCPPLGHFVAYLYFHPSGAKKRGREEIKLSEYWCLLAGWWKSSCNYHFISGFRIICVFQLPMLSTSPIILGKYYITVSTQLLSKCITTCSVQLAATIHDFFRQTQHE